MSADQARIESEEGAEALRYSVGRLIAAVRREHSELLRVETEHWEPIPGFRVPKPLEAYHKAAEEERAKMAARRGEPSSAEAAAQRRADDKLLEDHARSFPPPESRATKTMNATIEAFSHAASHLLGVAPVARMEPDRKMHVTPFDRDAVLNHLTIGRT